MLSTLTNPIAFWQQEYHTGNTQVDGQHQQIFEIVNALHDAVVTRKNVYTIQELLECLANHTIEHFQTEEALMMAVDYPEYDRHKQTHDHLLSKVDNLLLKFRDRNTAAVTTEITQFLTEWLAHHIKGEDQKMIQFFQNNIR
jgi:hemerythrin